MHVLEALVESVEMLGGAYLLGYPLAWAADKLYVVGLWIQAKGIEWDAAYR